MSRLSPASAPRPRILTRDDGATIAYHRRIGRTAGVVCLHGLGSDMTGAKVLAIEALCRRQRRAFVRFDYFGHGSSSGRFTDGTVGRWRDDTLAVIDRLTEGPIVVVGSSLGGWIATLAARACPRIRGLVATAPAPDFTEDLIAKNLTAAQRATLKRDGLVLIPNPYGPPHPVTQTFLTESRNHLVLRREHRLTIPVRLIHGMEDSSVPWQTSLRFAEALGSPDTEVTLVKAGDHRLSEPKDLARLVATTEALLAQVDAALSPRQQGSRPGPRGMSGSATARQARS
ncbi:MAG: alpha/beta hydrolase [Rhodospirillales bacterium]|nr:alpha/beta hydrolase [Rhodospirillales bacterium]